MDTYQKIQQRLKGKPVVFDRKDLCEHFPLRGMVLCAECNIHFTASWSKGRNMRHPYYHCRQKGCSHYGKSIKRDVIEGDFKNLLTLITPSPQIIKVAELMAKDIHTKKQKQMDSYMNGMKTQLNSLNNEIESFLGKILSCSSQRVIKVYEEKIEKLEEEKNLLQRNLEKKRELKMNVKKSVGTALEFLSKPCKI